MADRIRTRLLPALLTAFGVTLLAAGLLSYTTPVAAEGVDPPTATPTTTVAPTETPRITLPPLASAAPPSPTATPDVDAVATRVRIAALDIDLPVVEPTGSALDYPWCDVAMYLASDTIGQPGQDRATYLYAHAREGMFLPLLRTSEKKQRGMVVEVWTSDDQRYLYEITDVRRDQRDLEDASNADHEQLWMQTSEGPRGTPGKTQVIAELLSVEPAPHAEAHPTAKPVVCG
ncbi:MAG TPA: sortase [Candidatus Saccharimonadales bacterium]|nr:sortase [Candidatus Saccharimonadales bacterium]